MARRRLRPLSAFVLSAVRFKAIPKDPSQVAYDEAAIGSPVSPARRIAVDVSCLRAVPISLLFGPV